MPIITTTQIETAIVQPFSRILRELGLQEDALFVKTITQGATFFRQQNGRRLVPAIFSIDKIRETEDGFYGGFFINGASMDEIKSLLPKVQDPSLSSLPVQWFSTSRKEDARGLPKIMCSLKEMERLLSHPIFASFFKQRIEILADLPQASFPSLIASLKDIKPALDRFTSNHLQTGIYKVFSQQAGKRVPVSRVGGDDPEGILYIGQSIKLGSRLRLLAKSFHAPPPSGKLWQHGAEEIYWQCAAVQKRYPLENLFVEILPCRDPKQQEMIEISQYYQKFGEVPPFNGAIVKIKTA